MTSHTYAISMNTEKQEMDSLVMYALKMLCDRKYSRTNVEKALQEKGINNGRVIQIVDLAQDLFQEHFAESHTSNGTSTQCKEHNQLLDAFKLKMLSLGHDVQNHSKRSTLLINRELEIGISMIANTSGYSSIAHFEIKTIHAVHIPLGIIDNLVGIGSNFETKIANVLDNYVNSTFTPIISSLNEKEQTPSNFSITSNNNQFQWNIHQGNLILQGPWTTAPSNDFLIEMLKEKIKSRLKNQKLNTLKVYVSKRTDGNVVGECLLNNQTWQEGLKIISEYADTWQLKAEFQGIKQFIVFSMNTRDDGND
jgi:hypothetical protein